MNDKTALEIGTQVHEALTGKLSVSFDQGKNWEEVAAVSVEVFDMLEDFKLNNPLPKSDLRIYSSMSMSGSFTFKPKKAPKVRQTPPFWSAYK